MNDVEYLLQFCDYDFYPSVSEVLDMASNKLLKDENFYIELLEVWDKMGEPCEVLEEIDKKWFDNENVMLAAVKYCDGEVLKYVSDRLKNDKNFLLKAIEINEYEFENLDEKFKKDEEFILKAIKNNGLILRYLDSKFKKDKEIVLEAIKNTPLAFLYIDNK